MEGTIKIDSSPEKLGKILGKVIIFITWYANILISPSLFFLAISSLLAALKRVDMYKRKNKSKLAFRLVSSMIQTRQFFICGLERDIGKTYESC